ncbi:alpha/beta hydrolase family esterase [Bosea psychrotolerans]|uniref:Poly(3-hydroxybutyrate) depolymerase n=1 Tax=Bosea psychrotolerans TaxID=1871628 RepID=A0A2S4M0Q5_9HYPH|nr:PHB depolymerase family esterase [Bosea psychrotolerans]POR48290.1 poly(3-hydroxybutyrate) depolymerase [Bosea psychrotolerans]
MTARDLAAGRRLARWVVALAATFVLTGPAPAQNPADRKPVDSCPAEGGCLVDGGSYRIILPQQAPTGQRSGAIMYFHGYQGSAEETIADQGLVGVAQRLGVALIAADGMGRTWSYPGSPGHNRDEFAYVGRVLDDVARRFPVDPRRIMASGFSQGGSMVWYLACRMPARFAGFAPIAGAFWEPLPSGCAGPRPNLIHVHGTSDTTVPLAGRSLRSGYRQGDVFKSLAILAPDGCTASWAADTKAPADPPELTCRQARGCAGPARLELCLHAGGHIASAAWVERAWKLIMPPEAPPASVGARLTFP